MICTHQLGGMRSVVEGYIADGLFSRWNVRLLHSNVDGGFALRLLTAFKAYATFLGLLLTGRVGLVHCHAAMKGSFLRKSIFALTARAARVPVIFHVHGAEFKVFVSRQPAFLQRLISWVLEQQSMVVVLSESWYHYVASIAPRANVEVLHNYVNLPDLSGKVEGDDIEIPVLFLGVVGKRKGVYDLLPAFKDALIEAPELRLIIGGDGEVEKARAVAAELNIENQVVFAGWVHGEEKLSMLRRAKIYVLPSYNEGLPVSLLDAMGWQIPVVSTRVGGIPNLVSEGLDGLLIDAGDRSALTAALVRLAKDRRFRTELGTAGRLKIEQNFSRQVVLPKLEKIYSDLISKN